MLSPLLTGAIEPARNTAKACCPSRVHHAFGVSWALSRNCERAPKAWHPAGIGFLTINNRDRDAVKRGACERETIHQAHAHRTFHPALSARAGRFGSLFRSSESLFRRARRSCHSLHF